MSRPNSGIRLLLLLEEGYPTRYWLNSMQHLSDAGIETTFGTIRELQALHEHARSLGFNTFALNARSAVSYPKTIRRLRAQIRGSGFDVLHLSEAIQGALGASAAGGKSAPKQIFHRHHVHIGGTHGLYTKWASRRTDLTMAISQAVARASMREGVPTSKVRVVHNGVMAPRSVKESDLLHLRQRLGIEPDARVITIIGILRPEKGHAVLLDALAMLPQLSRPVHMVVVGAEPERVRNPDQREGSYALALRARSEKIDRARVHFVGFQKDISQWLEISDVVVIPSLRDAFGLVAIEAMASKKPLIASDVEGLSEVVTDGQDGLLVPPNDARSLADAINELLSDAGKAASLAATAHRTYKERFTLAAMVDGWISCYRDVLGI